MLLFSQGVRAQGWSLNPNDFDKDMTVYATITYSNGSALNNLDNYKVAAYVGEECRGIGELQSSGSSKWFYLRVYSNVASGETVTFKVWDITEGAEPYGVTWDPVTFTDDATIGLPSEPFKLKTPKEAPYIRGDANGDGSISSADVVAIVKHILSDGTTTIVKEGADMNGDGSISSADVVAVVRYILTNN